MNTRHRPLFNVITVSPKGAMFLQAKDCSSEVKDSNFITEILIITNNAPICKATSLIVKGTYNHIFWTLCIVHNLYLTLEEIEAKTPQIKEITW
jgi:hypothetical protein